MPNAMFKTAQCLTHTRLEDCENEMLCVVGHCGRDAELRYSQTGLPVASGSLAVSWGKRDQDQQTTWVNWKAWRETALSLQGLKKGEPILLIGKVQRDSYTARDGTVKDAWQLTVYSAATPIWTRKGEKPPATTQQTAAAEDSDIPF